MTKSKSGKVYVGGGVALAITVDVGNGTPIERSKVKYGPAEIAFRRDIEAWYADLRRKDPIAVMDIRE